MSSLSELGMLAAFSCNVEVIRELTHTCVYLIDSIIIYVTSNDVSIIIPNKAQSISDCSQFVQSDVK